MRIISLAPSITETIDFIGAANMLKGVSEHCVYPEFATTLPKVGGFSGIDFEKILRLRPDLVIGIPAIHNVAAKFKSLGIKYVEVKQDSLDDIYRSIIRIGRLLNRERAAKNALLSLKKEVLSVKDTINSSKKRVLLVIGSLPGELRNIYIASNTTFLGEILNMAGYENAYSGKMQYPNVTAEQILKMRPNGIIILNASNHLSTSEKNAILKPWIALNKYWSVQIKIINGDQVYIPGPRFIKTLRQIKKAL